MTRQEIRDEQDAQKRQDERSGFDKIFGNTNKITKTQEPIPGFPKEPTVEPEVDVSFDTARLRDLKKLDDAYHIASRNAADPKIQSEFRETFFAYRNKYFDENLLPKPPAKGAKA